MPRTSYGDKKQSQAWQLVAALMKRQGNQSVQLDQNSAGQAYLEITASLSEMGSWSGLPIEGVREAITQHLGESFLGIVTDRRGQKAGRGAEQWDFELKLWSTNLVENQYQFDKAWKAAKFGNTSASDDLSSTPTSSNEALFEQVREHCRQKILSQHSRMRLLSGEEIGVDQLYVDVWLLNRSPRTYQVSQDKLLKTFDLRNDRLGLGDRIKRNPGFEVANENAKLLILGKPGAGKTTFLKHLAVDWCKGQFQSDLIAVFIELRRIQDERWKLLNAIGKELGLDEEHQIRELKQQIQQLEKSLSKSLEEKQRKDNELKALQCQLEALALQVLLKEGKLLVLMDGLDEVPTNELRRNVQRQLRQIAEEYKDNRWILTCRTQVIESIPVGFTSVEVADFSTEQVQQFVQNWFQASGQADAEVLQQRETFNDAVIKNPALRELAVTPVLLSLMCLVLHDEGEIPSQVTDLYKKGIRLLLEKWNDAKAIEGWEVGNETYRQLSVEQKEALLIDIAAHKFENPENFVLFQENEIATHIAQFLQLANYREGVAVLKAVEAQHGLLIERADELWSFSHLTFQEHFTVQWLTQLSSEQLAEKITNPQWQQVVEQLVQSQQPVDRLLRLIKQSIDRSISGEPTLNQFLTWVLQKAGSTQATYKPATLRAFYSSLARTFDLASDPALSHARMLARTITPELGCALDLNLTHTLDLDLDLDHTLDLAIERTLTLNPDLDLALQRAHTLARAFDSELAVKLQQLRMVLPSRKSWQQWWQAQGQLWLEQLRQVMIEHRNMGHNWQFNHQQKQQLQHYYDVNYFLVKLMKIESAASPAIQAEIEDSLLLPWDELQRRYPEIYGSHSPPFRSQPNRASD